MKKVAMGVIFVFLMSCAGRAARPVLVQQYGDKEKSCGTLELELKQIEGEIERLQPQTNKTGKNVALGVTGVFFLVPLFFMDLSNAEREEIEAYRQRYNHLVLIAEEKQCSSDRKEVPPFEAQEQEAKG